MARLPPVTRASGEEGETMSNVKLAALVAAFVLSAGSTATAQSAKVVGHPTRANLIAWCKNHPEAKADCKEVRSGKHAVRTDRKELRADRKELKADVKAGDKKELKADKRDLRADRRDLRRDRRDTRRDARDLKMSAHR
jgi:Skp family chaperone for outer membrane proteins